MMGWRGGIGGRSFGEILYGHWREVVTRSTSPGLRAQGFQTLRWENLTSSSREQWQDVAVAFARELVPLPSDSATANDNGPLATCRCGHAFPIDEWLNDISKPLYCPKCGAGCLGCP